MKRSFLILCVLGCGLFAHGQPYSVIHVLGKIYNTRTGTYLSPGMALDGSASLRFETPDARAAVLSPSKGRFILQRSGTNSDRNDLVYTLSALITPVKGKMSSRAGAISNPVDFINKFGSGKITWIGDSYWVIVSPSAFPMDEGHFFFVRYQFRNETINKRLGFRADTLLFERNALFSVDGVPVDSAATSGHELFYYDAGSGQANSLTALQFVWISADEFLRLYDALGEVRGQERLDALQEILVGMYGNVSEVEIREVLKRLGR